MPKPEIRIFPGLEELSWAAAARFEELARIKAVEKKYFFAGLSGGSTPRGLYDILGSATMAGRIRWPLIHLFQVDERCVPPDHPESNYRMIREALLENVGLPEPNFHRMRGEEADLVEASRLYAADLARVAQPPAGEWPRLDLVFLGMGPDGHTASLFPGTTALHERGLWVAPNFVEKLNAHRLTLTLPVLNAAGEVIFLVAGADKAEVLREVLEGDPGEYPAQAVQPVDGRLSWFLDEAAAHLLSSATWG